MTPHALSHAIWSQQHHDVVIVRWPERRDDVTRLEQQGVPRLLLVEPGADPPESTSCLQDWLRLPADDADIRVRLRNLEHRAASHYAIPTLDAHGQLTYRGRTLFVSPIDEQIVAVLLERFGEVVDENELRKRVWSDGGTQQGLRVHVSRLRRQIVPLGLTIICVRGYGYAMGEATPAV